MQDFKSLHDLERLIKRYPLPADGVFQDTGSFYSVLITFIPGPSFRGTLPKNLDVDQFIQDHNWRRA